MSTTTAATAGQAFTAEARKMYAIGPRTRWNAKRPNRISRVHRENIIEDMRHAAGEYRGIESERRTAIIDTAHTALCAWDKFVEGYRIDGVLRCAITTASPWEFTAFLGEMVDSGASNMGEFERWFAAKTRETYAASA